MLNVFVPVFQGVEEFLQRVRTVRERLFADDTLCALLFDQLRFTNPTHVESFVDIYLKGSSSYVVGRDLRQGIPLLCFIGARDGYGVCRD